jgi:diguanylate cyclase (GGDEF)-like protein
MMRHFAALPVNHTIGIGLEFRSILVMCALASILAGAVFVTTTALRHNDEASHIWAGAFFAAVASAAPNAIWGNNEPPPTGVVATISASTILALGAFWCGARIFNGRRRSLIAVPVLLAGATAIIAFSLGSSTPRPTAAVTFGIAGILGWLGTMEIGAGPMRNDPTSRILQATMGVTGLSFITAAAVYAGVDHPIPPGAPVDRLVVVTLTGLVIVAAICLSELRIKLPNARLQGKDAGVGTKALPLLDAEDFDLTAHDRLERTQLVGGHVTVVLAQINDLPEFNTAFGREAGDLALMHFAEVLRSHVPVSTLLGYLGAGRFAIVATSDSRISASVIVAAIRTGLADAPLPSELEMRISARFGVSDTLAVAEDLDALFRAAKTDLDSSPVA